MSDTLPIVGITMGDPAGIGPEVAVKTLACQTLRSTCWPLLIGDAVFITEAVTLAGLHLTVRPVASIGEASFDPHVIEVLPIEAVDTAGFQYGRVQAGCGEVAFRAIRKGIDLALAGQLDAVVTGPIHKAALHAAGRRFAGHTEIFAHFTGSSDVAMLLIYGDLRVIHVTTHIPLAQVPAALSESRVLRVIELAHEACLRLGLQAPRIGVAGLNPHAGDEGLFGDEDQRIIAPAVREAVARGIEVEGPVPPDTLFPKALGGWYDICVAMYHDQGHIPLKVVGFRWNRQTQRWDSVNGVNITLGLPILRTSVDHGTAFDIAGRGIASADSMKHAVEVAVQLVSSRPVGQDHAPRRGG